MLAAPPVDREDDVADRIIDIDDDVGDQGPQQLLTGTHRHIGSVPGCRQVVRHVGKSAWINLDGGWVFARLACFQITHTA
jgi:hypothetical protein